MFVHHWFVWMRSHRSPEPQRHRWTTNMLKEKTLQREAEMFCMTGAFFSCTANTASSQSISPERRAGQMCSCNTNGPQREGLMSASLVEQPTGGWTCSERGSLLSLCLFLNLYICVITNVITVKVATWCWWVGRCLILLSCSLFLIHIYVTWYEFTLKMTWQQINRRCFWCNYFMITTVHVQRREWMWLFSFCKPKKKKVSVQLKSCILTKCFRSLLNI